MLGAVGYAVGDMKTNSVGLAVIRVGSAVGAKVGTPVGTDVGSSVVGVAVGE